MIADGPGGEPDPVLTTTQADVEPGPWLPSSYHGDCRLPSGLVLE